MARSAATPASALGRPVSSHVGGHLALDFCNTAGEHLAAEPDEMLVDWETFVRWVVQSGIVGPDAYLELLRNPAPMTKIVQLREAIHRAGVALARGERIAESDLAILQKHANATKPTIVNGAAGLRWRPDPVRAAGQLCAVLASEALSLFCSPQSARIGVCDGGLCGWLFIDDSRGKRRRWCDMKDCGNRAKARRYYEQQKSR